MGTGYTCASRWRLVIFGAICGLAAAACGGGEPDECPGGDCDPPACVEAWQCSSWTTDGTSDAATRTCSDQSACGTTLAKPPETATLPALDADYYECNVEPVLTQGCSMLGCHGTETGRGYRIYARGRLRVSGMTMTEPGCLAAGTQHPSEECIGSIECRCWTLPQFPTERRRSFDSARGFGLDANGSRLADMAESQLLKQPLVGGGFAHAGVYLWSQGDADYTAVKSWLDGARRGSACNSMN
ncbi:MAG TPA: hypothetical protein VNO30_50665 [Kofleriaceae bacterium]|nr:hypothetical protein [Kofleriaceae bacterium]